MVSDKTAFYNTGGGQTDAPFLFLLFSRPLSFSPPPLSPSPSLSPPPLCLTPLFPSPPRSIFLPRGLQAKYLTLYAMRNLNMNYYHQSRSLPLYFTIPAAAVRQIDDTGPGVTDPV